VAAVLLAIGGPLLAGLPPSGLAAGKAAITAAADDLGLGWLTPLLYLSAALTGVALVRAAVHLWHGWALAPDPVGRIEEGGRETLAVGERTARSFTWMPVALVAASVLVVFVPGLAGAAATAASRFADPDVHAAALAGAGAGIGEVAPLEIWKASTIVWGLGAGAVAVGGGAMLARRGRRGAATTEGARAAVATRFGRITRGFRSVHSGHVGDYTAWATLGAGTGCAAVLFIHGVPG
jgi:multicomponent Na+:H+ antiporter subunit D